MQARTSYNRCMNTQRHCAGVTLNVDSLQRAHTALGVMTQVLPFASSTVPLFCKCDSALDMVVNHPCSSTGTARTGSNEIAVAAIDPVGDHPGEQTQSDPNEHDHARLIYASEQIMPA